MPKINSTMPLNDRFTSGTKRPSYETSAGRKGSFANSTVISGQILAGISAIGFSMALTEAPINRTWPLVETARIQQNVRPDIYRLRMRYQIVNEVFVEKYLNDHPVVGVFLHGVQAYITKIFGYNAVTSLEVWQSPIDNETTLFLGIHSNISDKETLNDRENTLFGLIENDSALRDGLSYVVIEQR